MSESPKREQATLAGGCFWCLEAVYDELEGVENVESGYAGGSEKDADYEAVCSGKTGHAEVVRITFDPAVITFADLLDVFLAVHDPTTLNRQGNDVGTQYRSAIFFNSDSQKAAAEVKLREVGAAGVWENPIVTEIAPLDAFFPAEDYHRDYFARNPAQPYCQAVVAPKVAKFRKMHLDRLKKAARDS